MTLTLVFDYSSIISRKYLWIHEFVEFVFVYLYFYLYSCLFCSPAEITLVAVTICLRIPCRGRWRWEEANQDGRPHLTSSPSPICHPRILYSCLGLNHFHTCATWNKNMKRHGIGKQPFQNSSVYDGTTLPYFLSKPNIPPTCLGLNHFHTKEIE